MSNLSLASITESFAAAEKDGKRLLVGWLTPDGERKFNFLVNINNGELVLKADSQSYGCSYAVPVERVLSVESLPGVKRPAYRRGR
jgi:hypothetical protein